MKTFLQTATLLVLLSAAGEFSRCIAARCVASRRREPIQIHCPLNQHDSFYHPPHFHAGHCGARLAAAQIGDFEIGAVKGEQR